MGINYKNLAPDFCWRYKSEKSDYDFFPVHTEFRLFVEILHHTWKSRGDIKTAATDIPLDKLTVGELRKWISGLKDDEKVYLVWRSVYPTRKLPIFDEYDDEDGIRAPEMLDKLISGKQGG